MADLRSLISMAITLPFPSAMQYMQYLEDRVACAVKPSQGEGVSGVGGVLATPDDGLAQSLRIALWKLGPLHACCQNSYMCQRLGDWT